MKKLIVKASNKKMVSVTTQGGYDYSLAESIKEELLKKGEAIFNVCSLDYYGEFYLIGNSTEFIVANEMKLPIKLVEYFEDDFIHISKFGLSENDLPKFVDEEGNVRVGDLFDNFMWNGDTYMLEAELTYGMPVYTLTPFERDMKYISYFEAGVQIHKAYIELELTEDSDLKIYENYYLNKMKSKFN